MFTSEFHVSGVCHQSFVASAAETVLLLVLFEQVLDFGLGNSLLPVLIPKI